MTNIRISQCTCFITWITICILHDEQTKNKKFWEKLIAYFPWYDTGHIENDASKNSSIIACVFVTAVTFLPSRCLATIEGFLPSRCLATIGGFLASRCLAKIGGYTDTHTQTATWTHKPTLFFQINESRLKTTRSLNQVPSRDMNSGSP
jgi:hypothetical protein